MELLRLLALCLVLAELSTLTEGAPKHHISRSKKKEEPAKSRSYIDIDASDPFKVPKSSHYVNKPMPDFDAKVENKEGEDEGPHRGAHNRGEMGHGEMERMEEEGAKNLGRGDDRAEEAEREHMERESREHDGGRESEGDNFAEKGGAPSAENIPEEQHGMIQPPQESSEAPPQEDAQSLAQVAEMTEGAKGIQQGAQQVEADGKSVVQQSDPSVDPMAGVMGGLGGTSEEGFKKGGADPGMEEEMPLEKEVVNQMQSS